MIIKIIDITVENIINDIYLNIIIPMQLLLYECKYLSYISKEIYNRILIIK